VAATTRALGIGGLLAAALPIFVSRLGDRHVVDDADAAFPAVFSQVVGLRGCDGRGIRSDRSVSGEAGANRTAR
jgi:hypothetical protein